MGARGWGDRLRGDLRYVDGAEALRFTASANHTEWPESVRALATPGRALFIEVAALDSTGRKLTTSERQLLKLDEKPR